MTAPPVEPPVTDWALTLNERNSVLSLVAPDGAVVATGLLWLSPTALDLFKDHLESGDLISYQVVDE